MGSHVPTICVNDREAPHQQTSRTCGGTPAPTAHVQGRTWSSATSDMLSITSATVVSQCLHASMAANEAATSSGLLTHHSRGRDSAVRTSHDPSTKRSRAGSVGMRRSRC